MSMPISETEYNKIKYDRRESEREKLGRAIWVRDCRLRVSNKTRKKIWKLQST
jgi:hypothetical protein